MLLQTGYCNLKNKIKSHPFVGVTILEEAPFVFGDARRVGLDVSAIALAYLDRLGNARVEVIYTSGVAIVDLLLEGLADGAVVSLALSRATVVVCRPCLVKSVAVM